MAVDNCSHTFTELVSDTLPGYMASLRHAMLKPHKAAEFAKAGIGPVAIARACGLQSDFSGSYVLLDLGRPVYVGISRKVLTRIRQHVTGKSHFDASLVYAVAQRRRPTPGKRESVMLDETFRLEFCGAQEYLTKLDVAFVRIDNPIELYIFEAYAAMEFDTAVWNTFRTH